MHRFYTCGKLKSGEAVFMGESTVMAQPLVTKEFANFLCEINHAFDTLKTMTGLKLKAPEGVRVAMCPMVQKPWLQEGSMLANPYYGKEMPTCGSFR